MNKMIDYWLPYVILTITKVAGYVFLATFLLDITKKMCRWTAVTYCRIFFNVEEDSKDDSADVTQEVDK